VPFGWASTSAGYLVTTRQAGCSRTGAAGVLQRQVQRVSEYLGHSDPGFTLRTYTHLMPNSTERTKRAVDDALAGYIGATSVAL
jgi:integrase